MSDEERVYKDPWSQSLYNCTTGANYLRGGEYHRLIAHLEKRATEIETLLEALKRASRELEQYVDLQQKLDYIEYAATTQKEVDAVNAVIAKAEGRA